MSTMLDGEAVSEVAALAAKAEGNHRPIEIGGQPYAHSSNMLQRVAQPVPTPIPLKLTTLTSLADFVRAQDTGAAAPKRFLHVVSPTEVRLVSELVGPEMQRHTYATAAPDLPKAFGGEPMSTELFRLALLSRCVSSPARDELIAIASGVRADSEVSVTDDGLSQSVAGRNGISLLGNNVIRNPYELAPYRTFAEIEQPASAYIVRVKKAERGDDPFGWTVTEADGGAWRLAAAAGIRTWLEAQSLGLVILA